ncbi:MAG TPA: hypothetical protein VF706_05300, partial [Solirubrobacteraceae bacterium]
LAASALAASPQALATGYQAVGWGENLKGELGAFWRSEAEMRPIAVEGLGNIESVATGISFDLMLLSDGTVRASGADAKGQLGDGGWANTWERGLDHVTVAEPSGTLEHVTQVAAGGEHGMALLESGVVKTWGTDEDGNLGNGHSGFEIAGEEEMRRPKTVKALQEEPVSVTKIAAGWGADFALMSDGTLRGWGDDQDGELGINLEGCKKTSEASCTEKGFVCHGEVTELCSTVPRPVVDSENHKIEGVVEVATGGEASYARLENGKVLSWGSNLRGQLGTGGTTHNSRLTPPGYVQMGGSELTGVKQISAGFQHALAIRENGEGHREVVGWGDNEKGELGAWPEGGTECPHNPCYLTAVKFPGLPSGEPEAVAAGNGFSLVLINHEVWAVGDNKSAELANGEETGPEDCRTTEEVTKGEPSKPCDRTPTAISMPGNVRAIYAGGTHAIALLASGVEAPPPGLTVTPEKGALKYTWPSAAPSNAKLDARPFERPEFEGELSGIGEPLGAEAFNTVRPNISSPSNPYVGKVLTAKTGVWVGTPAPTLSIQWQRCKEGECKNIEGATGSEYTAVEADVGGTVRIAVTGNNGGANVAVHSPPTEMVGLTSKSKQAPTETISLKGKTSVTLNKYEGSGLSSKIPYEVKVAIGGNPKVTVGTPLP